jgi:hypothetical protein
MVIPPLLFVRPGDSIHRYAIPMAIIIAVGAFLPELIRDVRDLLRGLRDSRRTANERA